MILLLLSFSRSSLFCMRAYSLYLNRSQGERERDQREGNWDINVPTFFWSLSYVQILTWCWGKKGDPIQILVYDGRNERKGKVKNGENLFKKEK